MILPVNFMMIIMNAASQAKSNQVLANSTIEKIFSSVYRISKCESLVRTSVYELRSRKLIEIEDFDEFAVSALKFGDIHITELGEKAISNNYIPSESQTRDESICIHYRRVSKNANALIA